MKNKCKNECNQRNESACLDQHKSGYGCTRSKGHTREHIACCFSKHDIKIWEGEKKCQEK